MFNLANEYSAMIEKQKLSQKSESEYQLRRALKLKNKQENFLLGKIADVIIQFGKRLKKLSENQQANDYSLNVSEWEQNCS
ncbi:MAG: hypothetical protein JEZ06_17575 [Anaerolineaceae bacterium]|nr:hypothetical protein [Anaerolineaceae bacterium]